MHCECRDGGVIDPWYFELLSQGMNLLVQCLPLRCAAFIAEMLWIALVWDYCQGAQYRVCACR